MKLRTNTKKKAFTALTTGSGIGSPLNRGARIMCGLTKCASSHVIFLNNTWNLKTLIPPVVLPVQPPINMRKNNMVTGKVPQLSNGVVVNPVPVITDVVENVA